MIFASLSPGSSYSTRSWKGAPPPSISPFFQSIMSVQEQTQHHHPQQSPASVALCAPHRLEYQCASNSNSSNNCFNACSTTDTNNHFPPADHHHHHHHADESPATPKRCNKRYCDTDSLERSLKRVRLTSGCPGELRLQRDLRHAVLSHQWVPAHPQSLHHTGSASPSLVTSPSEQADCWTVRVPSADPSVSVTVTREDSMELVMTIRDENSSTGVQLFLSFPRRYPHQPPMVRRIQYLPSTNDNDININASTSTSDSCLLQEDFIHPGFYKGWNLPRRESNKNNNHNHADHVSSSTTIPVPGALQKIIIPASPEEAAEIAPEPGIVVLQVWSPVQRLTEVCDWLVATVLHNHSPHSQQQQQGTTSPSTPTTAGKSALSVQCPSFQDSTSSNNSEDGQSTPVHRNGSSNFLLDPKNSNNGTQQRLQHPSIMMTDDEESVESWGHGPSGKQKSLSLTDKDDDFSMNNNTMPSIESETFLLPGRFNLGYDSEQQQPMHMMLEFEDPDL